MTTEELVASLSSHRTLGQAPREELAWIADHCVVRHLDPGDVASRQTEVVDGLYILLNGRMSIHLDRGAGRRRVLEWRGGDVTGVLPYSRMLTPPGDTIVDEPTDVLVVAKADFPALIRHCYEVTAILVHVMTDRARHFTSADLRDEKMLAIGKLAAGLAHELNNPSSAAVRSAKSLSDAVRQISSSTLRLAGAGLKAEQVDELERLRSLVARPLLERMSGLERADREEEFVAWLTVRGLDPGLAPGIASMPLQLTDVDTLSDRFGEPLLPDVLGFLAGETSAHALLAEIEHATERIHALVAAVKGFTHMDHAPEPGPVDINRGVRDTVALLHGKARGRNAILTLDLWPDHPQALGVGAELNQVWMNLIDNAIDAVAGGGHVTVSTAADAAVITIRVLDDGPGIPPDIKGNIFEPFFTTKPIGEGTGFGLDIVRRIVLWHNGTVEVESRPGRTEFVVTLPAASSPLVAGS